MSKWYTVIKGCFLISILLTEPMVAETVDPVQKALKEYHDLLENAKQDYNNSSNKENKQYQADDVKKSYSFEPTAPWEPPSSKQKETELKNRKEESKSSEKASDQDEYTWGY